MKKILSTILVFALIAALPIVASASNYERRDGHEVINIEIARAGTAPTINGLLEPDRDNYMQIPIRPQDLNLTSEVLDLTTIAFDAWFSYDDTYIYILLSGDERFHYSSHFPGSGDIWNQSCIQISLAADNQTAFGEERLEFGLARNNDGEKLYYIWSQGSNSHGAEELVLEEGVNFAIANENGRLNYEVRIPWNTFLSGTPAVGDVFGINLMYVWSADEFDLRERLEFSNGTDVDGKNADLFAQVTVTDRVLEAAADEDDADEDNGYEADDEDGDVPIVPIYADTAAPATNDSIILVTGLAIVALAAAAVVKKRISVK